MDTKTREDFDRWFNYHPAKGDQGERHQRVRDAAKRFAEEIAECCPDGADRAAAFRKVREAMMTANAAISCGEA